MTKILSGLALAFVFGLTFFSSASSAHAETANILVGNNLTTGSTGQGVIVLQALLSEMGYLNVPTGTALGYYGSLTQSAVAKYQTTLGVYPAVGYYGPVTKVAMYSDFAGRGWLNLIGWNK